jgi:hypothetical protein
MSIPSPACHLILEKELDVFCMDGTQLLRAASHDRAAQWPGQWQGPAGLQQFVGSDSPAVAGSADGRIVHLLARRPDVTGDRGIFHARSSNYMATWDVQWNRIGLGVFTTGPAVACSGRAGVLYCCGRGDDDRFWFAKSLDAGGSWSTAWKAIGSGTFKGRPALATTADGSTVVAVGLGKDDHLWFTRSRNGANTWEFTWTLVGPQPLVPFVPNAGPTAAAVALSADGSSLFVVGRRDDKRFWCNRSTDLGNTWRGWEPLGSGTFLSSPSVVMSWDGADVYVTGLGLDKRVWFARSFDGGENWNVAWKPVLTKSFA